jgi:hypothetical protein
MLSAYFPPILFLTCLLFTYLPLPTAQLNEFDDALAHYLTARRLGSHTAELNVAHILEVQGYEQEAKNAFDAALTHAQQRELHTYHVKVRLATVLPRILPSVEEIPRLRSALSAQMIRLLEASDEIEVDNAPPLYSGYSTGFHLLFHGMAAENNVLLKTQLFRLYATMCPALLQGYFMELPVNTDLRGGSTRASSGDAGLLERPSTTKRVPLRTPPAAIPTSATAAAATAAAATTAEQSSNGGGGIADPVRQAASTADLFALGTAVPRARKPPPSAPSTTTAAVPPSSTSTTSSASLAPLDLSRPRKVRIGILSRFLHTHPVGLLVQGLAEILRNSSVSSGNGLYRPDKKLEALLSPKYIAEQWSDANDAGHQLRDPHALFNNIEFDVTVFLVDGGKGTAQYDAVQRKILRDAHMAYVLPSQHIGTCAQAIRNARLDVLVYPELGLDPLSYFLAYSRLAPVQATWLGHPDTSALPAVDYALSSHFEPFGAQSNYTETLYKMPYFGTQFVDSYLALAQVAQSAPRTVILNRAKYVEKLQIPKSAHLYIISHSLCKLHPLFDEVLTRILLQDR